MQREQIEKLEVRLNELWSARKSFQKRIQKAEDELSFAHVYEDVQDYRQCEQDFFERLGCIKDSLARIKEEMKNLRHQVEEFRNIIRKPIPALIRILTAIKGKASFHDFIVNGEITVPNGKDTAYIDSVMSRYRNLQSGFPPIDDLDGIQIELVNQLVFISRTASDLRVFKN